MVLLVILQKLWKCLVMLESSGARTSTALTARSRRTRVALLDAVRSDLRASGQFDAHSVAHRANCSAATFYSHFGSKDDALTGVFELVLEELVDGSKNYFTLERIQELGLGKAALTLVEHSADFFQAELLVFRAAIARISVHRGLRDAYRSAEVKDLEHLRDVITEGQRKALIRSGPVETMAAAVMVLTQGINNPRALGAEGAAVRAELAHALLGVLAPQTDQN